MDFITCARHKRAKISPLASSPDPTRRERGNSAAQTACSLLTVAKAAGATGWIVKPFDPDKLLQTLARVLP